MKINEIFESIQGEGKYCGYPVLFIRLSGCNKKCNFCDTTYHTNGKEIGFNEIVEIINQSKKEIVVWTGGEPLLQYEELCDVIANTSEKKHHLETNGSLITGFNQLNIFDYVCISPKQISDLKNLYVGSRWWFENKFIDIKVVTDCITLNLDLIKHATMLMPLTTHVKEKDLEIEQNVWSYCVKHNKRFCLRVHTHVWNKKRGV